MVKQISLFLENKKGRLAHVCRVLADADINIRALSIADTADFGVLRLIVNDPTRAYEVLCEKGFVANITQVLAIQVPDVPGGLADALDKIGLAGLDVEYMYAFIGNTSENAFVIVRVENPEEAAGLIEENGIKVLKGEQAYSL
jgi:hypothetical protein